jgi:hypothetical protein
MWVTNLDFKLSLFFVMLNNLQGFVTVNLAKLQQQSQLDTSENSQLQSFSMATYKRLALNSHLLERFISMLGLDSTLIKSHPNYDSLLQYGSLAP